jgi:integrase
LRFGEICDGIIALPASRTKNKKPHAIPLRAAAAAILAGRSQTSDFVFGTQAFVTWSYGKRLLDAALTAAGAKLEPWTLHDLRRSAATGMAEGLGVAPHIVEAILNHVSGHKAGVAGIYNRATYEKEKRAALVMWADHVLAAVEGRTATVVPMRA